MEREAIESAVIATANKGTLVSSGTTVVGWLLSSEAGVVIGIIGVVVGLALQAIFGLRRDRRDAAAHRADMREHERRMALLEAGKLTRAEDER